MHRSTADSRTTSHTTLSDQESRLTDIQYPASTGLNEHFTYDGYGRRASMTDGTGSQSYSYGNLDELLGATTTYTGLAAKTISYSYYPNGSRQTMTTPAGTFGYSYDAAGRVSSMTNPFGKTTGWSYQNNNWLATQILANGAVATYTHNALGQVAELLNQIGSTTISDFTISYDGVGNRSSIVASGIGTSSLNGTTAFTYNTKNELLEILTTRYGGFTHDFAYDSAGNPTSFKGLAKSYNSNNQQTATGFTYDSNGNATAYNGVSLTFDPENHLTSHGATLTAGYRGDGLRGKKQTFSGATYFLYDGSSPVVELDSSGSVIATNTFSSRGLISRRVSSVSVLYAFDSEGNLAQRTDASGAVLSDHLFDAHGTSINASLTEPFGYKAQFGYYTDNETGQQLLTNRYYDPQSGRFLTRDPISYSGGINHYSYVQNNPITYIDPSGLELYSARQFERVPFHAKDLPPISGSPSPILFAGTIAALDGPEPGPMDIIAVGYLTWVCLTSTAPPIAMPVPIPRPTPITLVPPAPPPMGKEQCYERYSKEAAWCGEVYTNDYIYEQCMENAWVNYWRCLNNLPPKPFPSTK